MARGESTAGHSQLPAICHIRLRLGRDFRVRSHGGAPARAGVQAENDVVVTATEPTHAQATAKATGAQAEESNIAAVRSADLGCRG